MASASSRPSSSLIAISNRLDSDFAEPRRVDRFRQPRDVDGGIGGVPIGRDIHEVWHAGVGHLAEDAAMAAGRDIAAGTGIDFGDLARGEELLLLDDDDAGTVAALAVGPDARLDVGDGIDDVGRPVVADLALRALRGVAGDRQAGVDQEVEPVGDLFDLRAALGPDRAVVVARGQDACTSLVILASTGRGGDLARWNGL